MISHITTLANGIIGVSVLAMPFCFKQCGIVLATLVLLLSSALSRLACHFLIKSAVMCRRRNFEFLAFHAFGPMGKFFVELCIIGFLLGTCIAYFVVVGDLGPQIIGEFIDKEPKDIRSGLLITTAVFIVLPLGLLRNVSSLASVSTASIAFYICLVLKVIGDSTHSIFSADCFDKIYFWRPAGMLQCLPIFALALFCQTQLFEIYETLPNATLEKMNQVVRGALNVCTVVYISVGLFGYIGFCSEPFSGNILMSFEPSVTSEVIKIGFVLSVAFSFPLVIFPCRASLNSLLFRRGYTHLETSTSYISETKFRCLTTFIVIISMVVGILIPSIEFVLGIVGSTIGVLICLIFPGMFFISISTKNTNERLLAQLLVIIGLWIMILGTYANLYAMEQSSNSQVETVTPKLPVQVINGVSKTFIENEVLVEQNQLKQPDNLLNVKDNVDKPQARVPEKPPDEENIRREPPVPVEQLPVKPQDKVPVVESIVTISPKVQEIINKISIDDQLVDEAKKAFDSLKKVKPKKKGASKIEENPVPDKLMNEPPKGEENQVPVEKSKNAVRVDAFQKNDIAVDAIKKEESELAADKDILNVDPMQRREQLDKTLVKHIKEQKKMMQEQKELLKDIERNEKKLEQEIGGEKLKDLEKKTLLVDNPSLGEEKKPGNEAKKEYHDVANKKVRKKASVEMIGLKKNLSRLITEKNGSQVNVKKPLDNESIDKDVHIIDNEMKKVDDSEKVKLISLDSKLKPDLAVKKSGDHIIKALNNQSNKISREFEAAEISNSHQNNNVDSPGLMPSVKNNDSYVPLVLKLNSQNKDTLNSDNLENNHSNYARKNTLDEHEREKREIEEKENSNELKTAINQTIIEGNKNVSVVQDTVIDNKKESCEKEEKQNLQSVNQEEQVTLKLINNGSSIDLIKTSSYLSGQEAIKTVSIDSELKSGDSLIKVKSRDLKSINYDNVDKT
ncbi:putative sodium-coupled neutral amino acid transporter 10 [Copidosoma floridanum]|uniref:putative sodium-coupled neutral amino acid transporter 10 n=1 Tax=Copidosoma floridanum TaxID=29053 RepID=UPI0006C9952A|nr:putative sodium-coupled neutral amino acid transporter 10 [Copidosoma floridanum]